MTAPAATKKPARTTAATRKAQATEAKAAEKAALAATVGEDMAEVMTKAAEAARAASVTLVKDPLGNVKAAVAKNAEAPKSLTKMTIAEANAVLGENAPEAKTPAKKAKKAKEPKGPRPSNKPYLNKERKRRNTGTVTRILHLFAADAPAVVPVLFAADGGPIAFAIQCVDHDTQIGRHTFAEAYTEAKNSPDWCGKCAVAAKALEAAKAADATA